MVTTQDMTVWNEDGTKPVDVITDDDDVERLAVNSLKHLRPGKFRSIAVKNGGSANMNVDGSVTPVEFTATPNAGKKFYVISMQVVIEDTSMNFSKFGGIVGGLTNGVVFKVKEGGEAERNINALPIKLNADLYRALSDVIFESAVTDLITGKFNLVNDAGTALELADADSDVFTVTIDDDLTPLDSFTVVLVGYEVDE